MTSQDLRISYEVFPARDADATRALDDLMTSMGEHGASLVSVTFGAGGSSSARSLDTVRRAAKIARCRVAAHLTCVGQTRSEVLTTAERLLDAGATDLVLLRGDPPGGIDAPYRPHPRGFVTTAEFVRAIREVVDRRSLEVSIAVSGYPEIHPSSPSLGHDLDLLAAKESAGADSFTTQMCFDADAILRYRDAIERRGITMEMSIGVMPLVPADRIAQMARKCGARIPQRLLDEFSVDAPTPEESASRIAVEFVERLRREGMDRFHLYTLNRRHPCESIISRLRQPAAALA